MFHKFFLLTSLSLMLAACGGEAAEAKKNEGTACSTNSDCVDGLVCLAYGDGPGACAFDCSVHADECGGNATCAGVGSVGVDVCQDKDKAPSEEDPGSEEERPRIPCASDDECSEFGSNAICAEWRGMRDCTLACSNDDQCNPPAVGGVTTTFMVCIPDEGDTSRDACLPNEACFNNPMDCIDYGDLFDF